MSELAAEEHKAPIPQPSATGPARVKEYHRTKRTLHIVELAISLIYWLAWLWLAPHFVGWLGQHVSSRWAGLGLGGLVMIGVLVLLELPLTYYSGYIIEQR